MLSELRIEARISLRDLGEKDGTVTAGADGLRLMAQGRASRISSIGSWEATYFFPYESILSVTLSHHRWRRLTYAAVVFRVADEAVTLVFYPARLAEPFLNKLRLHDVPAAQRIDSGEEGEAKTPGPS